MSFDKTILILSLGVGCGVFGSEAGLSHLGVVGLYAIIVTSIYLNDTLRRE